MGLDIHAETIAVAVESEVRSLGTIANRAEAIRKPVKKLGQAEQLRACYEVGPTGDVLYWQLAELGVACEMIAPTLVSVKVGDRVNTNRRDAKRLARGYRSGDLTVVWVPDEGSEALRDLVRARHRLSKFLLRMERRSAMGIKAWTAHYMAWVRQVQFPQPAQRSTLLNYLHELDHMGEGFRQLKQAITEVVKLATPAVQEVVKGLQALRGIAEISAVTNVAELGELSRLQSARQLMGYRGGVPSEESRGQRTGRGTITKTGNAHFATHRGRSCMELSVRGRP